MIKNISISMTRKLEDAFSGMKILKESLLKTVNQIKKEFEVAQK